MNDKILPFFDKHVLIVQRVITDMGSKYCERVERPPNLLYPYHNGLEHKKTKPRSTAKTPGPVYELSVIG